MIPMDDDINSQAHANQQHKSVKQNLDVTLPPDLSEHTDVYSLTDVSVDKERKLLEVQFIGAVLPTAICESDRFDVQAAWIDTVPSLLSSAVLGEERARRLGFGRDAIRARIEVTDW